MLSKMLKLKDHIDTSQDLITKPSVITESLKLLFRQHIFWFHHFLLNGLNIDFKLNEIESMG